MHGTSVPLSVRRGAPPRGSQNSHRTVWARVERAAAASTAAATPIAPAPPPGSSSSSGQVRSSGFPALPAPSPLPARAGGSKSNTPWANARDAQRGRGATTQPAPAAPLPPQAQAQPSRPQSRITTPTARSTTAAPASTASFRPSRANLDTKDFPMLPSSNTHANRIAQKTLMGLPPSSRPTLSAWDGSAGPVEESSESSVTNDGGDDSGKRKKKGKQLLFTLSA